MRHYLSFSNFLKNEEETYFTGLGKIGINKDDFKYFPQASSFFGLGQFPVNIGSYSILDFKKNDAGQITHVRIKRIKDPNFNSIKYDKDNRETIDKEEGYENFLVPIEDLEKLLLQGQQPSDTAGPDSGAVV